MTNKNFKTYLPHIKLMVFDIDGVLSDGSIHCYDNGVQLRVLNIKDGYALQLAVKKGIRILIISGGHADGVINRLQLLGITDIYTRIHHKLPVLQQYMLEHQIAAEEILYMGDDIPDYECLKHVGAPTCPADAANDIKPLCLYVSSHAGGKGCVRDVIEQVLKSQQKWLDKDAMTW